MCGSKKFPVKVTDEKRSRRIGFTITCLTDLKKKANDLLKVVNPDDWESLLVYLEDGTEICDEEFLISQCNKLFIITPSKLDVTQHGK